MSPAEVVTVKVPAASRQTTIIQLVNDGHGMSIAAIASLCGVSTETIRRDLAQLERNGDIQRVYGGAIPTDRSAPVSERRHMIRAGKRIIGRLVADMIQKDQWIFITGGSTGLAIAEAMLNGPAVNVMTPMPSIADTLNSGSRHRVVLTGGQYDASSGVTTGDEVLDAIAACTFDLAIVGIYGLDAGYGLVEANRFNMLLKQTLMAHSRRTIFVGDHTKMGEVGRYRSVPFSDVETIVTDLPPFGPLAERLRQAGSTVIYPHPLDADEQTGSADVVALERHSDAY
ncbi:DeoR/GlpR family DNA-binding transcription regulator [Devosia sp. A369]